MAKADSKVLKALNTAIEERRLASKVARKGHLIEPYRDQILALRTQDVSWNNISRLLKENGLDVSAESLRVLLDPVASEKKALARKQPVPVAAPAANPPPPTPDQSKTEPPAPAKPAPVRPRAGALQPEKPGPTTQTKQFSALAVEV